MFKVKCTKCKNWFASMLDPGWEDTWGVGNYKKVKCIHCDSMKHFDFDMAHLTWKLAAEGYRDIYWTRGTVYRLLKDTTPRAELINI